jgi:hypothetical protein
MALRTRSVTAKVLESEYERLAGMAASSGLNLSEWVRGKLWNIGRSEGETDVLLEELLALRTILVNLLFALAKGEAVSAEQMQALIKRADREKTRRAVERMSSAPSPTDVWREEQL